MKPAVLILLSLPLAVATAAAADAGDAPAPAAAGIESPFLPPPGSPSRQGQPEAAPLEFRGVMVDHGATLFNIVNPTTKKGAWVALRETGAEYVVRSHEVVDDNDTVTVEHQGRTLRLLLAKPKTVSSGKAQMPSQPIPLPVAIAPAQAQPAAQPNAQPQAEGPISPVVLNPTSADEARRLEAVAAEVRRRRALRQQTSPTQP